MIATMLEWGVPSDPDHPRQRFSGQGRLRDRDQNAADENPDRHGRRVVIGPVFADERLRVDRRTG